MNELINIKEQNGQKVCSARELHKFLEVKTDFTNWCKRMFEYGFIEDLDYSLAKIGERNAHNKIDYALTVDCAKEVSMLQKTEKGKQARRYFINIEKEHKKLTLNQDPTTLLRFAADEIEKRDKKIARLQPKADFVDTVFDLDNKVDIGQCSKLLGLPFGRNTLFKELRERGILFKNKNEPKQSYVDRGYFELKEIFISTKERDFVKIKILVTQKGLVFLGKIFEVKPKKQQLTLIK